MVTILLSLILAVPAYGLWGSNRLASWICIVLIVLLLFAGMVWRDEARAHVNWVDHWSKSEKERIADRRRAEAQVDAEERRRLERAREKIERREKRHMEKLDRDSKKAIERYRKERGYTTEENNGYEIEPNAALYKCDWCGQGVRTRAERAIVKDGVIVRFKCPYCRNYTQTKRSA